MTAGTKPARLHLKAISTFAQIAEKRFGEAERSIREAYRFT